MPEADAPVAVYWDSSAVLAALTDDARQAMARSWMERPCLHCLSSLAVAECCAVLGRLGRTGSLPLSAGDALVRRLWTRPWRSLRLVPGPELVSRLARRWPLRGADLWHLAAARALADSLPATVLLTFDTALEEAAASEGLAPRVDPAGTCETAPPADVR